MSSTNFNVGINNEAKLSSRVLKPPGGGTSNIFGSPEPVGNPPGKMSDHTYAMQPNQQQQHQQQQHQQHQQQYHQQQQQYHQQQQQYHQQQQQHIGDASDPHEYCAYQGEQQPPMADYPGVVRTGSNETVTSKAESVADRGPVHNHPTEQAEDTRSASGNQDGGSANQAQGGECSHQVNQQSQEIPATGENSHANEQQGAHAAGQQAAAEEIRPPTPAQPQANIHIPKDVLNDDGAPPSRRRGPVKPVSRNGLNDPPPDDSVPQRRVRVPPGGFSSGLW